MYFVYILQSIKFPPKLYTGFSTDTHNRLKDHNKGNSAHTYKFRPWKIIFYCAFENKATALNFEKYLKTSSGIAFRNKRLIIYNNNKT
jgi:putative endonuclease